MGVTTFETIVVKSEEPLALPAAEPAPAVCAPCPGPVRVRLVLTGLLLTLLLAALGQTVVATALPKIVGELPGLGGMSWAVTSYLLAFTVVLPLHGKLGDLLGRKSVFLFAIVVFVIGSALAGASRTMEQLIAFRALQGIGGGGLLIGALAIIADLVPPRERGRFLGVISAAYATAVVAGPLLGGCLADHASWRWCFYGNVPLGLLALAFVAFALKLPRPPRRARFDVLGALLLLTSSTCLVLLATWCGTVYAWSSHVVLGLGAGALGTALLFFVVEFYAAEPIIPPHLFRDRAFIVNALLGAFVGAALVGAASCLPTYLRMADGVGVTTSGLLMLPLMCGIALASPVASHFADRTGRRTLLPVLGCALTAVGMYPLSHLDAGTGRAAYSLWTGVLGLGIGMLLPVLVLAVQNSAHPADLGAATGAHAYFLQIGGFAGTAVFGTLFARRLADRLAGELPGDAALPPSDSLPPQLVHALPAALRDGYVRAYAEAMPRVFLYLVPVLIVGFLLAFLLKEKPLVSHNAPEAPVVPSPRAAALPSAGEPAPPTAGVPVTGTVQHPDGTTVPRAALTLIDVQGRQIGRGATGEDGRYALSTPGTGAYVLIAAAGGHQPQAVTVTVGERPVELDVVLGGAGRLAGTVRTGDGTPVREAMVTLTNVHGEVVASTRSGREGDYLISELVSGEYTLAASAPAFRPAALPVTVQSARETRQDIELAGGAVLRGTVRAGAGRPVEDARVTLLDAGGNVVDTATTGADGAFRFVDLSAGEYTVVATGYPPVATVLQIAGGGRTERDLQLGYAD
ncbi:MFS transporter [Streptomyces syringium]|uniref:alpha-amylase n=1 Tax=Streptomyces syringium TaxID=76729 RepID=A0ABS4YB68_9ACTN|nr:EmrB/QacA subfamily drug resistance transporter [Streptomyces syringium]